MQRKVRRSRRRPARSVPPRTARPARPARWLVHLGDRLASPRAFFTAHPGWAALLSVAGIVLALTAWRWSILDSPPYWDSAMGLCLEANFLADSGFDYHSLFTEQKRFVEGGPAIYLVSVLPSLVALLMVALPSPAATWVAYRLLMFTATAVLLVLVYVILRPRVGPFGALLCAAAVVTTPAFAAQVDLIGMDLPVAMWGVLYGWLLIERRFLLSPLVAMAAFFTKLTGGLLAIAGTPVLVLALAVAWWRGERREERTCWIALGGTLAVVAIELAIVTWLMSLDHSRAESYQVDVSQGLRSFGVFAQLVPDLVVLLALTLAGWLLMGLGRWRVVYQQHSRHSHSIVARAAQATYAIVRDPLPVVGWTLIFGMLAGLALTYVIPRYLTLPLPYLLMLLSILLFSRPMLRTVAVPAFLLLVGFNLANAQGRFFPRFPLEHPTDWRTGALLERSREYLKDHRQNIEVVRRLVTEAADTRVVAPPPFVHLLSLPRLGYVDRPLRGYALHSFTTKRFPPIEQLRDDPPTDLTFIFVMNRFYGLVLADERVSLAPPTADDRFLYVADLLEPGRPHPGLMVYQKPAALRLSGMAKKCFYLNYLWPTRKLLEQARQLLAHKQFKRASSLYLEVLVRNPCQTEARFQLASLLVKGGRLDKAREHLETLLEQQPDVPAAHRILGEILLQQGEPAAAVDHLQTALRLDRDLVEAQGPLGIALLRLGRYDKAAAALQAALDRRADVCRFGFYAGLALLGAGQPQQAESMWRRVIARCGKHAAAYFELAKLEASRGDVAHALADLEKAVATQPQWIEPLNHLAWLRATHPDARFRDGATAVRLAQRAERLAPNDRADVADTLAAAYAEHGQFPQAIVWAQRAVERARRKGDSRRASQYRSRLVLYRRGKPFRDPSLADARGTKSASAAGARSPRQANTAAARNNSVTSACAAIGIDRTIETSSPRRPAGLQAKRVSAPAVALSRVVSSASPNSFASIASP